jgi:hypothetical protein
VYKLGKGTRSATFNAASLEVFERDHIFVFG